MLMWQALLLHALLIRILFIGLLCLPLACSAGQDNGLLEIIGKAYDRKSGEFVYTEHHYQLFRDGKMVDHHVEYQYPDGRPLATKTLDYGQQPYAPAFQLHDWRDGYLEGAEHTADGYRLKRRPSANASLQTYLVEPPPAGLDLVADAGFDRYVRAMLARLLDAGSQRFEMAVPGRLASYGFEARLMEKTRLFDRAAARIRVQLSSLLNLIVDGIDITYALESGQLLRYEGISNIRDDNGVRYDARIDFPPEQRRFSPLGAE